MRHHANRYVTTPGFLQDWVANAQQASILQQHSTSRHILTAAVFVAAATQGQQAYLLQLQPRSDSLERHSTRQQSCPIKCYTVSWHVWWRKYMYQFSKFSLWFSMDLEVCLIEWYQKIVSAYDQKIPQSQTADNPMAPRGRATQPSRDTRKTIKQCNQLSRPHQDDCNTRIDIK